MARNASRPERQGGPHRQKTHNTRVEHASTLTIEIVRGFAMRRFDQQASTHSPAPSRGARRRLRVALLSYRSKQHCGGQGVYVRNLSRELVALGHDVEVFSGQPYPELEEGVSLTRVPSLDLYREPDPFRTPHWGEYRDAIDLLEIGTMWTGGFAEPLTFSLRVARLLERRRSEFDVVHDNQSLGYGLLSLMRRGIPLVATIHHPITVDRRLELEAASSRLRRLSLRRWYGFHRMQARVARRITPILSVSGAPRRRISPVTSA